MGMGQTKTTRGFGSIYQGNPFWVRSFDPQPNELSPKLKGANLASLWRPRFKGSPCAGHDT